MNTKIERLLAFYDHEGKHLFGPFTGFGEAGAYPNVGDIVRFKSADGIGYEVSRREFCFTDDQVWVNIYLLPAGGSVK